MLQLWELNTFCPLVPVALVTNQGQGSNQNNKNKGRKQTIQVRQGRLNFTTFAELSEGAPIMTGTFSIHHKPVVILFDSGASHSFISAKFSAKVGLDFCHTKGSYMISTLVEKLLQIK